MKSIVKILCLILPVMLFTACSGDDNSGTNDPTGTIIPTFRTTYYLELNNGTNTETFEGVATTDKGHSYLNVENNSKIIGAFLPYPNLPSGSAPLEGIFVGVHLNSGNNLYPLGTSPLEDYDQTFAINYDGDELSYVTPVTGTHSISDVTFHAPFGDGSIPPLHTLGTGGYATFRYDFNNIVVRNSDTGQNYTATGHIIVERTGSKTISDEPVPKFNMTYRLEMNDGTNTEIYEGTHIDDDGVIYNMLGMYGGIRECFFGVTGMNSGVEEVFMMAGFSVDENDDLIEAGFTYIALDDSSRMFYPSEPATGTHTVSDIVFYPFEVIHDQNGKVSFRYEFSNVGLEGVLITDGGAETLSGYSVSGYILCEPIDD